MRVLTVLAGLSTTNLDRLLRLPRRAFEKTRILIQDKTSLDELGQDMVRVLPPDLPHPGSGRAP